MAKAKTVKLKLDFPELTVWQEKLNKLDSNLTKRAITDALIASQEIIADKCEVAMEPHNKRGSDGGTVTTILRDKNVEWTQSVAKIGVGFDLSKSPVSIFLMRGTKLFGEPHIAPDRNLFNAVYGRQTKNECREVQAKAFEKVMKEVFGE